jgi:hypothetical protein
VSPSRSLWGPRQKRGLLNSSSIFSDQPAGFMIRTFLSYTLEYRSEYYPWRYWTCTRRFLSELKASITKVNTTIDILYVAGKYQCVMLQYRLKGHGNEADFLGFWQKLVPQRSLTLPVEPFRFWLRIRGDIRNRKNDSPNWANRRVGDSATLRLGESGFECLKENSVSQRVGDSPTRRVRESTTFRLGESGSRSLWWVGESLFEFFKICHHF